MSETQPPRVLLDTTVFCGALVNPRGLNFKVLNLAGSGISLLVLSQAVVAEFIHEALNGFGRGRSLRKYTLDEVKAFLDAFGETLSPELSAQVGVTYSQFIGFPANTPLAAILAPYVKEYRGESVHQLFGGIRWSDLRDHKDFHVIVAVVEHRPDILVTQNVRDLEILHRLCRVLTVRQFARELGIE